MSLRQITYTPVLDLSSFYTDFTIVDIDQKSPKLGRLLQKSLNL